MRPEAAHRGPEHVVQVTVREGAGGEPREHRVVAREVTLGRVVGNDIVLPAPDVSKRHARIVVREGEMMVVDLHSTNGTYVGRRRITRPCVITEHDELAIGRFLLRVELVERSPLERTREVDVTELRLLAAIAQRDEASRLVYADWLEQQGDAIRAEFLRRQQELNGLAAGDPRLVPMVQRLRELAGMIDMRWRYKVARPHIENCLSFDLACPREWGSLAQTEHGGVRYCDACAQRVYYCDTVEDAHQHAALGRCVAVDIVNVRRPGDLEPAPRYVTMGMVMPHD